MKNLSDLLQVLLSQSGLVNFGASVLIFLCLWLLSRYARAATIFTLKAIRKPFIPFKWGSLFFVLFGGGAISILSVPIINGLQLAEQYLNPTYLTTDTSAYVNQLYELELSKKVTPAEAEIIKHRTREIAAKVGSSTLAIYEVAYSECGLNPFEIRKDGIAAGWIQFTRSGLVGLGYSLEQVKIACINRDINLIMNLTEAYLLDRAKGIEMPRPVDIYTCVFAPGFLPAGDDQTLYSRAADGEKYTKNSVFDGYYTDSNSRRTIILNTTKAKDGRITKRELALHLELKKAILVKSYEIKN